VRQTQLLVDLVGRIRESAHAAVEGLDAEQLAHRPAAAANPIGWLAWHICRIQDEHIAFVADAPQLYTDGGWAGRLGMPADGADIGYGHDEAQVRATTATDAAVVLAYLDAVSDRTTAYLATLDDADLDRVVDDRWDPPVTLGVRLASVVTDNLQHVGQAAYVRGLLGDQ
jgi:uncharacterized damage-inducible protein DinB